MILPSNVPVDPMKLDTACSIVARTVSIRQSATETPQQFVHRLVRATLIELLDSK